MLVASSSGLTRNKFSLLQMNLDLPILFVSTHSITPIPISRPTAGRINATWHNYFCFSLVIFWLCWFLIFFGF
jgi:hypothetical protein